MPKIESGAVMALIVASTFATSSSPSIAADVNHGEQLARRWCAGCHVVAADQRQASADVPSFAAIARTPGFGPEKVAFFLLHPHPKMPDLSLSRSEANDIAAYIGSLAK